MSNRCAYLFLSLAAAAWALPVHAQSVISTHAGLIHYVEGPVYLGDQPLESHPGRFSTLPQGLILRTAEGRAEVLLTPGVFLRMGQRSAIRMIANDLADTQVELQAGSAIVDSGEPNSGTSVTLIYKNWRVHFLQKGVYRVDSDPPRLWVRAGKTEVFAGPAGQPIAVEAPASLPFGDPLVTERASIEPGDALSDWANGRSESITADNAITAQIDEDPASGTTGLDGFTYFPFLGVPSVGLGSAGMYSSLTPSQPGFNSIYLPGYTYLPLLVGLGGRRLQTYGPVYPRRIGLSPGTGGITPIARPPVPHPAPAPVHPIVVHPIVHH